MAAARWADVGPNRRRVILSASSYGTGELIRHALDAGIRHYYSLVLAGVPRLMVVWDSSGAWRAFS